MRTINGITYNREQLEIVRKFFTDDQWDIIDYALSDYQPDLYYYWDSPIEEDYNWRDAEPEAECLCEICFDILNTEKKIKWKCV